MNIKKYLSTIITAILSIIVLVFSFVFSKFPESAKPFSLMEKL